MKGDREGIGWLDGRWQRRNLVRWRVVEREQEYGKMEGGREGIGNGQMDGGKEEIGLDVW